MISDWRLPAILAIGLCYSSFIVSVPQAPGADLDTGSSIAGAVVDHDGRPIAGATVRIWTAGVRVGSSPFCPSCWADCGKTATSDTAGQFLLKSLDPQLVFRVLFVAKGYEPRFARIDPQKHKPLKAALKSRPALPNDPRQILSGQVVDSRGKPVAGALVEPFGYKREKERMWTSEMRGIDPLAVTDSQGRFEIITNRPLDGIDLKVSARAMAPKNFALVPTAKRDNRLAISEGATVRGRIVDDGRPVAGVQVGLVQVDRQIQTWIGAVEIGTDSHGEFLLANLPPETDYNVYGIMHSLANRGSIAEHPVRTGRDGTTANVGDLAVEPAFHITGRLVLSDGKPLPAHTRVLVSRDKAWDSQIIEVDADRAFTARGIPAGLIEIIAEPKGYHPSAKNSSFAPLNGFSLKGLVHRDIDGLLILMEPGEFKYTRPAQSEWRWRVSREEQVERAPLMGVVAVAGGYQGAAESQEKSGKPNDDDVIVARPPGQPKPLPKIALPPPLPPPVAADADVPKRTVVGRVVDDRGRPVAGADVWYPVRWAPDNRHFTVHAKSADNGRFRLEFPVEWLPKEATAVDTEGTIWAYAPGYSIGLGQALEQAIGDRNAKPCEIHLGPPSDRDFLTVVSPDDVPVRGAHVRPALYDNLAIGVWTFVPRELLAKTVAVTDQNGRVRLPAFPLKKMLKVSVETAEYGVQEFRLDNAGGDEPPGTLKLRPAGRIEGRVVAQQRELFRGMSVFIRTGDEPRDRYEGVADLTVDADGRFVVPKIASGPIELLARLADERLPVRPRLIERDRFSVDPGRTTRIEIPLEQAVKAHGMIQMKGSGAPVAGAVIFVHYGEGQQGENVTSDARGQFAVNILWGSANQQVIYVPAGNAEQPADSRGEPFTVPDGNKEFELPRIELVKTRQISGRLLDKNGKPLDGYTVHGNSGSHGCGYGSSDSKGEFTLDGVPENMKPDSFEVRPEASRRSIPAPTVIVSEYPLVLRLK